jgi:hypothetical protein
MPGRWPDEALVEQAAAIGPAVLELIDSETRWVHRRIERIELLNATELTRAVATDLTVPTALQDDLGLYPDAAARGWGKASRFVLPLGVLPKGPLQDFTLTPADVHRLTAEQTNPLMIAALVPYARRCGAPPEQALALARRIVRSETPQSALLTAFDALLDAAPPADVEARERFRSVVHRLNSGYVLLVALDAVPGTPTRVSYVHRQVVEVLRGAPDEAPLTVEVPLGYASGPGPPLRVEVIAPDGLEIETASIVAVEGSARRPLDTVNTAPGGGAFVQLRAPDRRARPAQAGLQVVFGWQRGGIHHMAAIAGLASTGALLTATIISYLLDEKMKGSSASTLLAAPALVTSLALGFATTRVTSAAANRLRFAALAIALFGVAGGLTVSLLGEDETRLNLLHGVLIGLTALSALVTAGWPGQAVLRGRSQTALSEAQ